MTRGGSTPETRQSLPAGQETGTLPRQTAIEPIIGHLKMGFRLSRNLLKSAVGNLETVISNLYEARFIPVLGSLLAVVWQSLLLPRASAVNSAPARNAVVIPISVGILIDPEHPAAFCTGVDNTVIDRVDSKRRHGLVYQTII